MFQGVRCKNGRAPRTETRPNLCLSGSDKTRFSKLARFLQGVTRIGAFPGFGEKAALEMSARRVHSGKGPLSTTCWAITTEARWCSPLFCALPGTGATFRRLLGRRVPKRHLTLQWSWHLNALPRFGQPCRKAECAGEVIEQGRMRSGAGREGKAIPCTPRKAESGAMKRPRTLEGNAQRAARLFLI